MKRMLMTAVLLLIAAGCSDKPAANPPAPAVTAAKPEAGGLVTPAKAESDAPKASGSAATGGASSGAASGSAAGGEGSASGNAAGGAAPPAAAQPAEPAPAASPPKPQEPAPAVTPPKAPAAEVKPAAPVQEPPKAPAEPAKPEGGAAAPAPAEPVAPPKAEPAKPAEPKPAAQAGADVAAKAQAVFKDNCMACHGEQLEGGAGPNLTKVGERKTKDQIVTQIMKGSDQMPPFKDFLSAADVDTLASWLATKK